MKMPLLLMIIVIYTSQLFAAQPAMVTAAPKTAIQAVEANQPASLKDADKKASEASKQSGSAAAAGAQAPQVVVDLKADAEALNPLTGETALIRAAKAGDLETVKSLITQGANVDAQDKKLNTALHYAASRGHAQIVGALIQNFANTDIPNGKQAKPLDLAMSRQTLLASAHAIASEGEEKNAVEKSQRNIANVITVLSKAFAPIAMRGRTESMRVDGGASTAVGPKKPSLLDKKLAADKAKDGSTDKNKTAAHGSAAAISPEIKKQLFDAAKGGKLQALQKFAADKIDFNTVDSDDNTPLHVALLSDQPEPVIIFLIKATKNLDARNKIGDTPLHIAAQKINKKAAEKLIDAFAVRNLGNKVGKTPLKLAQDMKTQTTVDAELKKIEELIEYLQRMEAEVQK